MFMGPLVVPNGGIHVKSFPNYQQVHLSSSLPDIELAAVLRRAIINVFRKR